MTQDAPEDEMDSMYGKSPAAADKPKTVDEQEAEEMTKKAVVPLKVLMGEGGEPLKEGDEVVIKITGINGQDAEIEYSKTKPSEIGKSAEPSEEMSPEDELSQMDKQYQ